jgi:hypothetical protein
MATCAILYSELPLAVALCALGFALSIWTAAARMPVSEPLAFHLDGRSPLRVWITAVTIYYPHVAWRRIAMRDPPEIPSE